jgi:hypothetical protein
MNYKAISLRLSIEHFKQVEKIVQVYGLSKTRIIERALTLYFKEVEKTGKA